MRRVRVDSPAAVEQPLALDVVSDRGDLLVRAGAELTPRRQRLLAVRGAAWCFVNDPAGAAIDAGPALAGDLADLARDALARLVAALRRQAGAFLHQPTARLVEAIHAGGVPALSSNSELFGALHEVAAAIAALAPDLDGRAGYLVDRPALDDLVGHPVGVAVLAARIGALVGFERRDVYAAALAGLLHDVGLVVVSPNVRETPPERRTRPQQRRYEDHTVLGEALLRRMLPEAYPALVAAEHHEHQSGDGYPRRLRGGHRVLRPAEDVRCAELMTLISEVVAVADRYERLLAPAPGFDGLPPVAARQRLVALAQRELNAEVVQRFVESIPVLPTGAEVRVSGGPCDGALAVVSQPSVADPDRPRVIIIEDADGRRAPPLEVDLGVSGARAIWSMEPLSLAAAR